MYSNAKRSWMRFSQKSMISVALDGGLVLEKYCSNVWAGIPDMMPNGCSWAELPVGLDLRESSIFRKRCPSPV